MYSAVFFSGNKDLGVSETKNIKRLIMDQIEDDDYSGKKVTKEPDLCHLAILVNW